MPLNMPFLLSAGSNLVEESAALAPREAASGIFGSISLACWIFLLIPQLIENYRNGNADAISIPFICIWLVGDVTNLAGSLMSGLVPVVILTAIYYCFTDAVLISQSLYYRFRNKRHALHRRRSSTETPDPTTPLLGRRFSDSFRQDAPSRRVSQAEDALAKIIAEREKGRSAWLKNISSILGVCVIGMAGWTVAWQIGMWKPTPQQNHGGVDMAAGGQVLGYISAVAYLGARLPQIYKNYSKKSCEGLSLLFFMLSLMGNLTYAAGIICHSTDKDYILTNLPWLIGSLGTMFEDVTIFAQFRIYAPQDELTAATP